MEVAKDHRLALRVGQIAQQRLDLLATFEVLVEVPRRRTNGSLVLGPAGSRAAEHLDLQDERTAEPGAQADLQRAAALFRGQSAERLLNQIVGVGRNAPQPAREVGRESEVRPDQRLEGMFVPTLAPGVPEPLVCFVH